MQKEEGLGLGSGVWVHSGVYTFPGVFYELLEVRVIRFQELLSCMGYPSWSLFFYT